MPLKYIIVFILFVFSANGQDKKIYLSFYGLEFIGGLKPVENLRLRDSLSVPNIISGYIAIERQHLQETIDSLKSFRKRYELNDWLYYQLVRNLSQEFCSKRDDYEGYTLYKWYFMVATGFDARLAISANNKLIFYIYNQENIYDIPYFILGNKKYVCLNIHDFGPIDLQKEAPIPIILNIRDAENPFSYKITRLPDFDPLVYAAKSLEFTYNKEVYHFNISFNKQLTGIYNNYPVVDFDSYFNIPFSKNTYESLIPLLKANLIKMTAREGVDYLMCFTRYAFLFENDQVNFGKEKRLSPEETLFSPYSDCDDRAALFFYLVREIYNLPMIALLYSGHINIAVAFEPTIGNTILYKGIRYTICEPTPQVVNLPMGESARLSDKFEIVYAYNPNEND